MSRIHLRSFLLALALVPMLGLATPVFAQVEVAHRWTGVYFGGAVDFMRVNGDTTFEPLPSPQAFSDLMPTTIEMRDNGIGGRIFGGYNWRAGWFLISVEGDYSFGRPAASGESSPIIRNNGTEFPGESSLTASVDQKWLVTGRVRGGFTIARTLIYGVAGLAVADVDYRGLVTYPARVYAAEVSTRKTGWTVGAGVEFKLSRFIHTRFEYRVVDLGDEAEEVDAVPADPGNSIKFTWQTRASDFSAALLIRF